MKGGGLGSPEQRRQPQAGTSPCTDEWDNDKKAVNLRNATTPKAHTATFLTEVQGTMCVCTGMMGSGLPVCHWLRRIQRVPDAGAKSAPHHWPAIVTGLLSRPSLRAYTFLHVDGQYPKCSHSSLVHLFILINEHLTIAQASLQILTH